MDSAVDIDASLSEVVPIASRLSATKLVRSPTTVLRSLTALPTSFGSSASSAVTAARLRFSCRSRPVLSCSADTSTDRFLMVEKMSLLWSPSAENACDSLIDGVADVGALAAQIVGGGVDERAQGADTARLGGLQSVGELFQLRAEVVPFDRDGRTVLRE